MGESECTARNNIEKKHFWMWHSGVIDGKREGWVAIVRSCSECGRKEVAHVPASAWIEAKGDYALEEHYK